MDIPGIKKIRYLYNALRAKLYLFKGSDGYHTFDELYEHRHALFGAFIKLHGGWKSKLHSDGSSYNGWFIAGTTVNGKQISYHLPLKYFDTFPATKRSRAPKYDGHTPKEVISTVGTTESYASGRVKITDINKIISVNSNEGRILCL